MTAPDQADTADATTIRHRLRALAATPAAQALAAHPALDHLIGYLPRALSNAASPERALNNLERFIQAVDDLPPLLTALADDPHILEMLVHLFAGSQFLTEILLRNPGYVSLLTERTGIAHLKGPGRFLAEARIATDPWLTGSATSYPEVLDALRRYQQRELLRIGLCDLNGLLELSAVTAQLSHLADTVIQTALEITAGQRNISPVGFAVIAMGKLGGGELNYSSDVDLLFLVAEGYDDRHMQAYARLGARLIAALSDASAEGFLYRVDMRLRPWGKVGPLTPTVNGYLRYLQQHARLWEKQALLRARVVAGDELIGNAFIARSEPLLFASGPEAVRSEVYGMKQLTEAHLRETGRIWGEVKLGEGSIRDVEFVAQYLQLAHGGSHPELRTGNTVTALARLTDNGFLSFEDHRILSEGYTFLRTVEHYLQLLEYRQTHILPEDPADLRYLARRLGFEGRSAGPDFVMQYQQHSAAVRGVYLRHLAAQPQPAIVPPVRPPAATAELPNNHNHRTKETATMLDPEISPLAREHLTRMAPAYRDTFDLADIERHAQMAAALTRDQPVAVAAEEMAAAGAEASAWRVTIVGYDYLGVLSLIAGLFFAYGFSITDGNVHTYEPGRGAEPQRKIVDVFTVTPVHPLADEQVTPELWLRYTADLTGLIHHLQARQPRDAQGELAKRITATLRASATTHPTLPPVDIEIDNDASPAYTVLRISASDTPGFLYEFTNALALNGVHIAQVFVISAGDRVQDTLYVTDGRGQKITAEPQQRELRAATVLVKHFTHLLPRSPNPESALLHFNEYLGELFSRPSWPDELASLERPEVLDALARLLGVSEFLWDDFLRMQYANLFPVVANVDTLDAGRSRAELVAGLDDALTAASDWRDALNAFKDREMFRIDMRHILGHVPVYADFAAELTDLAEVVLAAGLARCHAELTAQFGQPQGAAGVPAVFCLAALGKAGGRELGFASDVELMFVYEATGVTDGPRSIGAAEFYEKVVVELGRAIRARREGIFEIDLQLRPYGKAGSLAVSLDAFRRYFSPGGPAWSYERQALVKLRPIAGDAGLGETLTDLRDEYVYAGARFDVAAMRAMRERQIRHLVTPGTVNAKYSRGGLVDVEYIVQGLQVMHGHRDPALRVTNTADAISALARAGIVSDENAARLSGALMFLQQLINALRMVRGNNKDLTVPPPGSEEFAFLARRLGYDGEPARLSAALEEHIAWVQRLSARLLG